MKIMPSIFQVLSSLHEYLLDQEEDVLKVEKFQLVGNSGTKKIEIIYDNVDNYDQTREVPLRELNTYIQEKKAFQLYLYAHKGKFESSVVASQKVLNNLGISAQNRYTKINDTDDIQESREGYDRLINILSRYRYATRVEKQSLITGVNGCEELIKTIKDLKLETSSTKQDYLKSKLLSAYTEINFDSFFEVILHYYHFNVSQADRKKIEKLFLAVVQQWYRLEFSLPDSLIPHVSDFIERQGLSYAMNPENLNNINLRKTLLSVRI